MKILIDICHPAHVHFFKNPIQMLQKQGVDVVVTSRDKECAIDLLKKYKIPTITLPVKRGKGAFGLMQELVLRNKALYEEVQLQKPDLLAGIGGIFIAQVGAVSKIPSMVFYDGDNAKLQNLLTYPFAGCVVVPRCYQSWVPRNRNVRYNGYHELAYLHPEHFKPNAKIAFQNGIKKNVKNFFIRLVAWEANHDKGHSGLNFNHLHALTYYLKEHGNIIISSEATLPEQFKEYQYKGRVDAIHHVMAHCALYVGESPTMASEAAILGVPSIFTSSIICGNMIEQEKRYGLVKNLNHFEWPDLKRELDRTLDIPEQTWKEKRDNLLNECVDVSRFVTKCLLNVRPGVGGSSTQIDKCG